MDNLLRKEGMSYSARAHVASVEPLIFYIALAIFLLVFAAYGGLVLLNRAQEDARTEEVKQIEGKLDELRPEFLNPVLTLDAQLRNLKTLLTEHMFASNIFRVLESSTYPNTYYDSFSFTADQNRVELSGKTTGFASLAQQIAYLERDPRVENLEFGGLSFGEGALLQFKLILTFAPEFIRAPMQGIKP